MVARYEKTYSAHVFEHPKGAKVIIGLEDTADYVSPGIGGCRILPNESCLKKAKAMAIRLSQIMTWKAEAHNLNASGGKAVIIGAHLIPRDELLNYFAECVNSLEGRYLTAIDVGTTSTDMQTIALKSPYVIAPDRRRYSHTDPSYYTALGVHYAINGVMHYHSMPERLHVNIQGLGQTGSYLAGMLCHHGHRVHGFDTDPKKIKAALKKHPHITIVDEGTIRYAKCDIFAPCAMGPVINKANIHLNRASFIIGSANDPVDDDVKIELKHQHVPDYIANAGGLIFAVMSYHEASESDIVDRISRIEKKISELPVSRRKMHHQVIG